jgi:hypothetical protein
MSSRNAHWGDAASLRWLGKHIVYSEQVGRRVAIELMHDGK